MKHLKEPLKPNPLLADKPIMKLSNADLIKGYTLTELLVVLVIMTILGTLAVKSYRTMMANNQAVEVSTALNSSLRLAKTEAVQRSTQVVVCPLVAAGSLVCDNSAVNWQYGWMVMVPATSEVIQTYQISKTVPVVPTVPDAVTYGPSGIATGDFSFTIQPTNCDRGYLVSASVQQGSGGALDTQTIGCP